jgi:hypothetical protein
MKGKKFLGTTIAIFRGGISPFFFYESAFRHSLPNVCTVYNSFRFFTILFGLRFTLYRDVLNDNDRRDYAILLQLSLGLLETCFILWRKPAPAPAESGRPRPVSSCSQGRERAWCRNRGAEASSSAMVVRHSTT